MLGDPVITYYRNLGHLVQSPRGGSPYNLIRDGMVRADRKRAL